MKMKRVLFVVAMAVATMFAATSCEKDDDNGNSGGGSNGGGKQLSRMTIVSDSYTSEMRLVWNGSQLQRVEEWEEGERRGYYTYNYSGGQLTTIAYSNGSDANGEFRLSYTSGRLTSAQVYSDGTLERSFSYEYNSAGKVSRINVDDGDYVVNCTWTGGNLTRLEEEGEGSYTFTYDNMNSPYSEAFAITFMLESEVGVMYSSVNNPKSSRWNDGETMQLTYTYTADNYPSTYTSGEGHMAYFQYTDGTGTAPSGNGGGNGGGGGEATYYTISAQASPSSYGYVNGGGSYAYGSSATLTAVPYSGYEFEQWSDGSTQNPRTVTVTGNATYTAYFASQSQQPTIDGHATVTFGNSTWEAGDIGAGVNGDNLTFVLWNDYSSDYAPVFRVDGGQSVGSYECDSYTQGSFCAGFYWNYASESFTYTNGNSYPIWWGNQFTQTITYIDMNSQTIAFTVAGDMYNAEEYFMNDGNDVTQNIYVDVASTWQALSFSKNAAGPTSKMLALRRQ